MGGHPVTAVLFSLVKSLIGIYIGRSSTIRLRYLYASRHGSKQMVRGQLISSPVFVAGTRRRENAAQTILLKAMKA